MDTSKIIITLALAIGAATAFAAPIDKPRVIVSGRIQDVNSGEGYMGYTNFVSTKSRAEVIAELAEARRRGELFSGEDYPGPVTTPSTKTRAEVIAELREAQRRGEIYSGDDYPGPQTPKASAPKTRAAVLAELKLYRASHPQASDDGAIMP
jgi:hypothetical protein